MNDGFEILEVKIHHSISREQFSDTDDGTNEQFISNSECTREWKILHAFDFEKALVWNHENCIAVLTEALKTPFRIFFACRSFGFERIGDYGDGHRTLFFCQSCDMACCSSTGAASHTCGNDRKLCIGGDASQCHFGFKSCSLAFCWIASCSSTSCSSSNQNFVFERRHKECLSICIDGVARNE